MKLPRRLRRFNAPQSQPTLFDWADVQDHVALSHPARVLANRFGLPPQRAALVAELAGLGGQQCA